MKTLTIISGMFLSVLLLSAAHADVVQAIQVKADYFPNNEYAIGLDLDENHLITRIYFEQDQNKTFYTLDELNAPTTIFEVAGIKLVQMRIANHTGNTAATIELDYVQNYLTHNYASLLFGVNYNAAAGHYDITDLRNNQIIHQVSVTTRYSFLRFPIGIASIDTE